MSVLDLLVSSGQLSQEEADWRKANLKHGSSWTDFRDTFTDPVQDFTSAPLGSATPGVYTNTVGDGLKTTRNIAQDAGDLAYNLHKDDISTLRTMGKNATDLGQLFDNPAEWYKKSYREPVYGDGKQSGWWDRNGQYVAMIPGAGPMLYAAGQGMNIANDYERTGDEEAARRGVRQGAATVASGYTAGQLTGGMDPGYLKAGTEGAIRGGGSVALGNPDATGSDILRGAAVGGTGGVLGEYLSQYSPQGRTLGNAIPSTANSVYMGNKAADDYEEALRNYRQSVMDRYNQWKQGLLNQSNESVNTPTLSETLTGTQAGTILESPEQQNRQTRLGQPFGFQGSTGSSQTQVPSGRYYL